MSAPALLVVTSGEFIFTEKMVKVAEMSPDMLQANPGLSAEIALRYNLFKDMRAELEGALEALDPDGETTCYDKPDELSQENWDAAIALRGIIARAWGR